jgi:hypothetical protein
MRIHVNGIASPALPRVLAIAAVATRLPCHLTKGGHQSEIARSSNVLTPLLGTATFGGMVLPRGGWWRG